MLGFNIVKLILAWYRLLFAQTAGTNRVYPRLYLAASLEMIILAIIATFIFTLHFDADQVWEHPAFMVLGAFNFCFGWYVARPLHPPAARALTARARPLRDFAYGNIIGLFMNSFIVYFLWRYTILVNMRLKMAQHSNWIDRGCLALNYLHALSGSVFLLIFVLGPIKEYEVPMPEGVKPPGWGAHTAAFFFYIAMSWFSFVATYLENKFGSAGVRTIMWYHTYYVITLCIACIFFLAVYGIQTLMPGPYGEDNPNAASCLPLKSFIHAAPVYCSYLSGQWVIVANWFWFFTFIAAPLFIPPEPPMMESYQIGDYEEPLAGIQMH